MKLCWEAIGDALESCVRGPLTPTYILLELRIILISLIIYKPSTLIISPWTFSTQLGAGTSLFCLSQCAISFCTLSPLFGIPVPGLVGTSEVKEGFDYS